ncbi:hypothetical protein [Micromonospora sp. NPDC049102]|uniref:hypothetical protein n=1 Tax=Micromonospora sp. NPDC049102 TaxID=3364265 RepID=UPI003722BD88
MPDAFPGSGGFTDEFGYTYLGFSSGTDAAQGRWASGPVPDGKGEFRYDDSPRANAPPRCRVPGWAVRELLLPTRRLAPRSGPGHTPEQGERFVT